MAHELDMTNGRANMAYVGDKPWHELGAELQKGAPIEQWRIAAGMDWKVREAPVHFDSAIFDQPPAFKGFHERKVLFRSDTLAPLSVVGDGYRIVQPGEVLEFYRDLTAAAGFELETAGCLKGGRKFWALAKTGNDLRIMGTDVLKGYLLLATSCDGSLATTAQFTTVRVVCQNTLNISVYGSDGKNAVKVPHSRSFDPMLVKQELGLAESSFAHFGEQAERLAGTPISKEQAARFFFELVCGDLPPDIKSKEDLAGVQGAQTAQRIFAVYDGGIGQDTRSAKGTAWGLVNAVTRYYDHERNTRTRDARVDSAFFGEGNRVKQSAFLAALKIAA